MQIIEGQKTKRKKFAETLLPLIQEINPKYLFEEDEYAYNFSYWIIELVGVADKGLLKAFFAPITRPRIVCNITLEDKDSLRSKPTWIISVGDLEEMKKIGQLLENHTNIPVTIVTE